MARKEVNGKPQLHLLKRHSLEQMALVRMFGVAKYENDTDWKLNPVEDYLSAALRHIYKHLSGEQLDPESGLDHLAHGMVSLMLALEINNNKSGG